MLSFSPGPLDLAPQQCELGPTLRESCNIKEGPSRVLAGSARDLGVPGPALNMEA